MMILTTMTIPAMMLASVTNSFAPMSEMYVLVFVNAVLAYPMSVSFQVIVSRFCF